MGADRISIQRCLRDRRGVIRAACRGHCCRLARLSTWCALSAQDSARRWLMAGAQPIAPDPELFRKRVSTWRGPIRFGRGDQLGHAGVAAFTAGCEGTGSKDRNGFGGTSLKSQDLPFAPVTYLPLLVPHGRGVIFAGTSWRYPA